MNVTLPTALETMSPAELKEAGSQPGSAWWLWLCWLETANGCGFVYGCAARTFRTAGWSDGREIDLPNVGRIILCQCIVTDDAFGVFHDALDKGVIDPALAIKRTFPKTKIAATRDVIQETLGQSAVRARLFYTLPDVKALLGTADSALETVLSLLQEELNLPFKDKYASRFGNFEVFELQSWFDGPQPFLIEVKRDQAGGRSGPQIMEICRSPEFANAEHRAHLVGRVNGDVVVDCLVILAAGERRVPVPVPELLDQFDFRLFDASGAKLLHNEHSNFINRIGFVLSPIGRQMTLQDDLSARAANKGGALASQASTVISHSAQRSLVGGPAKGSWREFAENMQDTVAARLPKASEDKWFDRGVEGEVGAIAHLNHLLDGGAIRKAVLVDPWFGADALRHFALRLSSQNIHLTIVTSWITTDPDTGATLDRGSRPTERLESTLRQVQPFLNPRLSVINLTDGQQQAFHDRYLLLYPHEGQAKVFLLSNSINKIAGNWPFAMSLFAADVSLKIQHYIEGLCDSRDTAKNRALTTTLTWP